MIDDQGVLIGPAEIVAGLKSLDDLAGGVQPVVHEDNSFDDMVRILFTLDAGWWEIEDGVSTYVVRRGRIVQQTNHGLIRFTGPPPDEVFLAVANLEGRLHTGHPSAPGGQPG